MSDIPLPDDLAEIAREAEALVAAALDADAKQAAAKAAVQGAVEQIVNKAQEAVSKLYDYLKPGAHTPVLAILWPTADAPAQPTAPAVVVADPAVSPVVMPADPVAADPVAEVKPADPVVTFPVVEGSGAVEAPAADPAAPDAVVEPVQPAAPALEPIGGVVVDFPVGEAEQPT